MKLLTTIRRLSFCLLLILAGLGGKAQRTAFYNLNVENGLIQSQVWALAQDNYGHLWIGTLGGLARFDGKNFTNYTVREGMPDNEVSTIAFDKTGKLWIGSPRSICSFDGRSFKKYTAENTTLSGIGKIKVDPDNKVWFTSESVVYSIEQGKFKKLDVPGTDSVISMLPEKDGVWVTKPGGKIFHYHNNKWDSLSMPLSPINFLPVSAGNIFRDKKSRIWITSNGGLFRIDSNRIVIHRVNDKPVNFLAPYLAITEDNHGDIWLATFSGVLRITDKSLIYYNRQNGLSDNAFRAILTDAEGNVWMGSDGQGLFRFSGSPFTVVDESMGLKSGQVRSLIADRQGRLYFGTMDAGLYRYDGEKVTNMLLPFAPTPTINAMAITADGKLWIGTLGGLIRYDQAYRLYAYPMQGFPYPSSVNALYTDSKNRLWIGFANKIMYRENDSFVSVPSERVFVRSFLETGEGKMLIATNDEGIMQYSNGSLSPFKTNSIIDSSSVLCFTMRGNNELWVGTSDNGVMRYNIQSGTCSVINKSNGLHSDFIYNIVADNSDNVWIGTGFGIHKISIGSEDQPIIKFYGKSQGVSGMESNHNAVVKMNDGSIWFGTTNGALHYQPQSQTTDAKPLSIVLQSVKLFGEGINDTSYFDSTGAWYAVPYGLHLPPRKNNLSFTFQAISLSGGNEQIMYRYRIEGLDAPWSDWSATNSVTFSALPSGKYVLHVESNTGGELHYPFEIITPFHKTGWFRLLVLAGCILLGITLQYIANRIKQNRIKLIERTRLEEQNRVRQRTAEDFHDEVGNKLTRINVLANVLKNKISLTPETQRIIGQIEENTAQLYSGTKDILWSLKPSNDGLYEILHRIRDFGGELFQDTDIDFIFLGTDIRWQEYKLPMDVSRNLIMIFKEALNNTLKYSKATKVTLDVRIKMRNVLQMTLKDNGQGFDIQNVKRGHGIDNMYVRVNRIKGRFYIDSKPGKGTILNLAFRLPLKETKSSRKAKYM
jgi:ligand-binding sensor domain-containing protein/signal transduction histidine kinase